MVTMFKIAIQVPILPEKTLLFDLYHDPVKGVLRLYINQVYHDHVIFTRRECMRQIFRGQGWGGQGESSRPPPTIWVQMMKMTMISIVVEGEVDEMQLSSLRKVTIKLVPKKKSKSKKFTHTTRPFLCLSIPWKSSSDSRRVWMNHKSIVVSDTLVF